MLLAIILLFEPNKHLFDWIHLITEINKDLFILLNNFFRIKNDL